jgi:hypothetical protein
MKKLSRQVLLGGAIFIVLVIASLYTANAQAACPTVDNECDQVLANAKQLLTLLNEKKAEEASYSLAAKNLGMCEQCEADLTQDFRDIAEETVKFLEVYRVITTTVISGDDLSALKKQARESDEEDATPKPKRRLLEDSRLLSDLVMAFPEDHTPVLKLDTLGEFEYARPIIIAPLQMLFPSEDLLEIAPAINGWICNLNGYDLSPSYKRKTNAKDKLAELWANSAEPQKQKDLKREYDIVRLVVEVVDGADDLWRDLRKSL